MVKSDEQHKAISIHAPREGGDSAQRLSVRSCQISIHAPREGGDPEQPMTADQILAFQSTPPARGATEIALGNRCIAFYFNPRPPRGGRLKQRFCLMVY